MAETVLVQTNTTIKRKRELPILGTICVKIGDIVSPKNIVAKTDLPGNLFIIRVADELGIHPSEVRDSLLVKEGDTVSTRELIAKKEGLFGIFASEVRSSYEGIVEFISDTTGHIGIRGAPKSLNLKAHYPGEVISIIPQKGVEIQSHGTLLQGIFGVGGERTGVVKILSIKNSDIVEIDHIPADCTDMILCGGCAPTSAALKAASERGAVAIITGSITDEVLTNYLGYDISVAITGNENISMTVIVTEGFGVISISDQYMNVLKNLEGGIGSLSGATQIRAGAVRPEILIER